MRNCCTFLFHRLRRKWTNFWKMTTWKSTSLHPWSRFSGVLCRFSQEKISQKKNLIFHLLSLKEIFFVISGALLFIPCIYFICSIYFMYKFHAQHLFYIFLLQYQQKCTIVLSLVQNTNEYLSPMKCRICWFSKWLL